MVTAKILVMLALTICIVHATRPTVLWHGMGDTCCYSFSMGHIQDLIKQQIPDIYTYSIEVGSSIEDDEYNGFFMNVNDQVDYVCKLLASDPNLADGFNAVGFSQGSQFLRAYVQRCNSPPVHNLITLGGQHQGVYGFPRCPGANYTLCNWVRELLEYGAYEYYVQSFVVQAEYWHDPFSEAEYLSKCIFLPDINNEGAQKNQTYKNNLMSLENFVMVKFLLDGMVQPIESEWFGFYEEGQDVEVVSLRDSTLYKEDWLGLQVMDKMQKLHFLSVEGDHLQFTDQWFIDNIVPFLNNTINN